MKALLLGQWNALLAYQDIAGAGPARVFIHGLGTASSSDFPGVIASPAMRLRRSLLVDLLGFGFSERPAAFTYTLEDHARTVAMLLDHLGLAGCEVVGHSAGGSVAIVLATSRPELVARLVLAEANLEPGPQEGSNAAFSRSVAGRPEEEYVRTAYPEFLTMLRTEATDFAVRFRMADPRAIHRTAVSLVSAAPPILRERLLGLEIPKVYIFGEQTLQNADMAARAAALPEQGVPVFIVPGVDHGMGLSDQPAGFAEVLQRALMTGA